jgi:DNA repair exonuclease SbcCD ATPase subunit
MKVRMLLPWLLTLVAVAGVAGFYSSNQKKEEELKALRADGEELQQLRAQAEEAKKGQSQADSDELARLRRDHEELLRLRNEVRQLRGDKQQLAGQVQAAQSQAEKAQEQVQARLEAIRLAQTAPTNTPEQDAAAQAFRARYGLAQAPQVNPATGLPQATNPEQANANACINSLRMIDAAKQQWASVMQKPKGAILTAADLLPFLPNNTMPSCPAGGIYTLNPVGLAPLCNMPGHALPK